MNRPGIFLGKERRSHRTVQLQSCCGELNSEREQTGVGARLYHTSAGAAVFQSPLERIQQAPPDTLAGGKVSYAAGDVPT